MCRKVTCKECGRPTWSGCGAHVEQVLGDVPESERCGRDHVGSSGGGMFSRLLGR